MICRNCGVELIKGQKFCFECGKEVPTAKKCIKCGIDLDIDMNFCPECGSKQDVQVSTSDISIGNRNVIAGDVVGKKDETYINGNATIIKNEDQTSQIKKCHVCGSLITVIEGYDCKSCGEFTCVKCFDLNHMLCKLCINKKNKHNEENYKEVLKNFLQDGIIDVNERKKIEELQKKYEISTEKAVVLENEVKQTARNNIEIPLSTMEKINIEKAKDEFYEDENIEISYGLIAPIYNNHPNLEEVLNIYIPVLIKKDLFAAKKIIADATADSLPMCLGDIEISIREKNFGMAERKIEQGKKVWKSTMLDYYEALMYLELAKTTEQEIFVSKVEEIVTNFKKTENKLELSFQAKINKKLEDFKGNDTSFYTKEFCNKNNLYTNLICENKHIVVGKDGDVDSLQKALNCVVEGGTIILKAGVYSLNINLNKKVKIRGCTESIRELSSADLPIIVLDSSQTCEIIDSVEVEGVVFTHKKDLTFSNLLEYAEEKTDFDENLNPDREINETVLKTCLLVSSDSKFKNIAIVDSLSCGITFAGKNSFLEDSIISHCYNYCICCTKNTDVEISSTRILKSNKIGVVCIEEALPSFKNCDISGNNSHGIYTTDNAKGMYVNCRIYNNKGNGIVIRKNSVADVNGCEIHHNRHCIFDKKAEREKLIKIYSGVVVSENAKATLKNVEIYCQDAFGILMKGNGSCIQENCNIHDVFMEFYDRTDSTLQNRFILIEPGKFSMGSRSINFLIISTDLPFMNVTINRRFYIDKYPVSCAEWYSVMERGVYQEYGQGRDYLQESKKPVTKVSWYDALVYCNKRSIEDGFTPCYSINGSTDPNNWGKVPDTKFDPVWDSVICDWNANGYRLPTEAEWEYAARAGRKGRRYDSKYEMNKYTWNSTNSYDELQDVGTKRPNNWGIYDMLGNAYEWCWNWFTVDHYWDARYLKREEGGIDPIGVSSRIKDYGRIIRGGDYNCNWYDASFVRRERLSPGSRNEYYDTSKDSKGVGFRVVRTYLS